MPCLSTGFFSSVCQRSHGLGDGFGDVPAIIRVVGVDRFGDVPAVMRVVSVDGFGDVPAVIRVVSVDGFDDFVYR